MSPGLFLDNKKYISAKEASAVSGYSQDYIGQLARANKISSKRIGRNWYISEESILNYKDFANELGLVPETPTHRVEPFLPELKKKPERVASCPEVKISKLDPACITVFTSPTSVPNPRTVPVGFGKLLVPSLGIIFVGIILNANGADLQKSLGKLLGNFGENLTANVSSTTPQEDENNLGSNLSAQALTQKISISPADLRSAFKNFVRNPNSSVATPASSSGTGTTTVVIKETIKEVPVKVISNSGLEVELRKLLADPSISSSLRGPKGSNGQDAEEVDLSDYITQDFLEGQVETIFDSNLGESFVNSLEDRLSVSFSTGELDVSGGVDIGQALSVGGIASFTHSPTLPHMFTTWPAGTSNYADASLVINPASAVADSNLLSASVAGSIKFLVDAEGDIYGNNLILTGSTSQGATTIAGNLDVQDNTTLGDAASDTITFNGYVNSNVTFTKSDPSLIFNSPTATDTDFWFGVQEDGGGDDDDTFQIGDGATPGTNPFITINTSGNVGIGTTNMPHKLDVYGVTGNTIVGIGDIPNAGAPSLYLISAASGYHTGSPESVIETRSNHPLVFGTNDTERMRISSTGNVGVATNNPGALLDIYGTSTSTDFRITRSASPSNYFSIAAPGGTNTQSTLAVAGTAALSIRSNGGVGIGGYAGTDTALPANGLIVSGNVGIGGTNPSEKLDVSGALTVRGGATTAQASQGVLDFSSGNTRIISRGADGSTYGGVQFLLTPSTGSGALTPMVISTSGSVGIGDTSPDFILDIETASADVALTSTTGTNRVLQRYINTGGTAVVGVGGSGTGIFGTNAVDYSLSLMAGGTNAVQLGTNNTAYMTIINGGNVGIGTTNPGTALEVNGAITSNNRFSWTGESTGIYKNAANQLDLYTNGSSRLTILSGGNVGIGDTSPDYPLEITSSSTQVISLSNSSIAHGITGQAETDVGAVYGLLSTTAGGAMLQGISDTDAIAFRVEAFMGAADPTDTTPAILLRAAKKSGTNVTDMGNSETVFQIQNLLNTPSFTVLGSGNVGIGTISPGAQLSVWPSSSTGGIEIATQAPRVFFTDTNGGQQSGSFTYDNGIFQWINSSTKMTLSATGNLGIGTTNPTNGKLEVSGTISVNGDDAIAGTGLQFGNYSSGGYKWIQSFNSQPLSINPLGNSVGIGTTSPFSKLTVQGSSGSGIIDTTSGDTTLINADLVGQFGFRSIDADGHVGGDQLLGYMAGVIEDNGGDNIFAGSQDEGMGIAFYTSGLRPSSNAAFTPAERMRITKAGNVGIGRTSPSAKLDVNSGGVAYPSINVETMGIFSNNGSGGSNAYLSLISGNTGNTAIFFGDSDSQTPGQIGYNHNTNAMTVTVNASTAMTILSSGNVGIGTASPSLIYGTALTIAGTAPGLQWRESDGGANAKNWDMYADTNNFYGRLVNDAESAATNWLNVVRSGTTVSSVNFPNGNVGIGTSNPNSNLQIVANNSSSGTQGFKLTSNVGGSLTNTEVSGLAEIAGASTWVALYANQGSASWGAWINGNGYLSAAAWTYGSDRRLKENISYMESGLEKILALKPATFDYIDGAQNNLGFIAQDVQEVIPEAVIVTNPETGMLGLKTEFITPLLVKAVQDLNAKIEAMNGEGLARVDSIWDDVVTKFADAANGIQEFFAEEIYTKNLCVQKSNGDDVCVTGDELEALLINAGQSVSGGGGNNNSEQPAPEEPVVEQPPAEEPAAEETPPEETMPGEEPPVEEPIVEQPPAEEPTPEETP